MSCLCDHRFRLEEGVFACFSYAGFREDNFAASPQKRIFIFCSSAGVLLSHRASEQYFDLSFCITLDEAKSFLEQLQQQFDIDLNSLLEPKVDLFFSAQYLGPFIKNFLEQVYETCDEKRASYIRIRLIDLLWQMAQHVSRAEKIERSAVNQEQTTLVDAVLAYQLAHLDEKLGLGELSRHFGCTSQALSAAFYAVKAMSVSRALRMHVMQEAAKRLTEGHQSIIEIAGQCGYSNASKFAHAFRRYIGLSPSHFRGTFFGKK